MLLTSSIRQKYWSGTSVVVLNLYSRHKQFERRVNMLEDIHGPIDDVPTAATSTR